MIPVYTVSLPDYQVQNEPNHAAIGKQVDDVLRQHFLGQTVVVRGISLSAHPNLSTNELIVKINQHGTDRYDPQNKGDRYENIGNKHIDFFAFRRKVTPRMQLFKDVSWGFYHGAKKIHGAPVRIDLLLIYDSAQLKAVLHQYEGRPDKKRDGFVFKDSANKPAALRAILIIS